MTTGSRFSIVLIWLSGKGQSVRTGRVVIQSSSSPWSRRRQVRGLVARREFSVVLFLVLEVASLSFRREGTSMRVGGGKS